MLTNRSDDKWKEFIALVKKELTDKNDHLRNIPDVFGENPKPIHELIFHITINNQLYWFLDERYEINKQECELIEDLFHKIFSVK